jgi:hypothetical protein
MPLVSVADDEAGERPECPTKRVIVTLNVKRTLPTRTRLMKPEIVAGFVGHSAERGQRTFPRKRA